MALSCDLRICGKSGVVPSKINLTARNFSFCFFDYIFPEVNGLSMNDLGEDAVLSMPETGLAIIPGYVSNLYFPKCCDN